MKKKTCEQCMNPRLKSLHTCKKSKPAEDYFTKLARVADDEDDEEDDDAFQHLKAEDDIIAKVMLSVETELRRATSLHGAMRSLHEGYAVILEEMDELWDEVKKKEKKRKKKHLLEEATQISAMAARLIVDLLQ